MVRKPPTIVVRTIKRGRVKIFGHIFAPSQQYQNYDGRLDGMRYAFGLYYRDGQMQKFVSLWGSEAARIGKEEFMTGPDVVDGYLPWTWWDDVTDKLRSTCPECGAQLELWNCVASNITGVLISPDGFCLCDGEFNTYDELVSCTECEYTGELEMED